MEKKIEWAELDIEEFVSYLANEVAARVIDNIPRGKLSLKFTSDDLDKVLKEVLEENKHLFEEKKMTKSYGERYIIIDSETDELWSNDVYHNVAGAKASYCHASKHYDRTKGKWVKERFDDQTRYKIVKVNLTVAENE